MGPEQFPNSRGIVVPWYCIRVTQWAVWQNKQTNKKWLKWEGVKVHIFWYFVWTIPAECEQKRSSVLESHTRDQIKKQIGVHGLTNSHPLRQGASPSGQPDRLPLTWSEGRPSARETVPPSQSDCALNWVLWDPQEFRGTSKIIRLYQHWNSGVKDISWSLFLT